MEYLAIALLQENERYKCTLKLQNNMQNTMLRNAKHFV